MADVFSKSERSRIMSLIKGKDTKLEKNFLKLVSTTFYPKGIRYRKHYKKLPGKPDIAFVNKKIAIFVDGDFWHGYKFKNRREKLPKIYWVPKIEKNMERDRKINRELKKLGWKVLRFWEHSIKKDANKAVKLIGEAIYKDNL